MSQQPLPGNPDAAKAAELLKAAKVTSGPERQQAAAQQATAAALLAVAYEIRRAGATGLGVMLPNADADESGPCGADCMDEYGFPETCQQPKGHDGKHRPDPDDPRCNKPITICLDAGEHDPVCRCQLAASHDGPHFSGQGSKRGKR
ncbi:hypothetical protein [Glutamicibacter arilaitensis]|uniref:Uncharacterized protein n=1 Tax=Glutamicibacter arilaitensis TaxID=256701 RepID=A0A2N7S635_9MICC|nr:hypothetical protein [Glutamicibacter arilaitensis]PMQ21603.1 hypothetical protein CIK84_08765 [Glutamicibacter arilaitensis]